MNKLLTVALAAMLSAASWALTYDDGTYTWTYVLADGGARITAVEPELSGDVTIPATVKNGTRSYSVKNIVWENDEYSYEEISNISVPVALANNLTNACNGADGECYAYEGEGMATPSWSRAFDKFLYLQSLSINGNSSKWKIVEGSVFTADGTTLYYHPNGAYSLVLSDVVTRVVTSISRSGNTDGSWTSHQNLQNVGAVYVDSIESFMSLKLGISGIDGDGWDLHVGNDLITSLTLYASTVTGFANCRSLESVYFESSVRELEDNAFENCYCLTTIEGGDGLTKIGNGALSGTAYVYEAEEGQVVFRNFLVAYNGEMPECLEIPEGVVDVSFNIPSTVTELTLPSTFRRTDSLNFSGTALRVPSEDFWLQYGFAINCYAGGGYSLYADGEMVVYLTIPGSIQKVKSGLFCRCNSLRYVTMESGVTSIGSSAFQGCNNLASVGFPSSLKKIGSSAFYNCWQLEVTTLPTAIDRIGYGAFNGTSTYEQFVESSSGGVLYIGNWCLGAVGKYDEDGGIPCPSTVAIKAGTRGIADGAFECCSGLKKVTLPKGLKTIGCLAFSETGLTSISLPDGLISLGEHAFVGSQLTSFPKLPSSLTEVGCGLCGDYDYQPTPWYVKQKNGFIVQSGWLIGYKAFTFTWSKEYGEYVCDWDESKLPTKLTVPSGVQHIAGSVDEDDMYSAGYDYSKVTELVLPDGLKTIGNGAFQYSDLKTVELPASVTDIGVSAFDNASGMILFKGEPPTVGFEEDGDGPFGDALEGEFIEGTEGWTEGMEFAGLTMYGVPDPDGVFLDELDDYECDAGESVEIEIYGESETAVTYKVTGLPKGLSFKAATMLITGKPSVPGKYTVTVVGTNAKKRTASTTFMITVGNFTSEYFEVEDGLVFTPGESIASIDLSECGLDFDGGDTLKVAGLPKGLSYNAKTHLITGTPTVPGNYTITFTGAVKNGKKSISTVATAVWTVDPLPVLTLTAVTDDDASTLGGTLTGGGSYLSGKKITLKATAKSGYVFAGWSGIDEERTNGADLRNPSLAYVTGSTDEEIFGAFVKSTEDAASLSILSIAEPQPYGIDFDYGDDSIVRFYAGVMTTQQVCVASLSLPTVKVKGLPSGLKYNSKTQQIIGVPTKPGDYLVTVTASNASGASVKEIFEVMVIELPIWAHGSYVGKAYDYNDERACAAVATVSAAGKISGYLVIGGKRCSFSKNGFDSRCLCERNQEYEYNPEVGYSVLVSATTSVCYSASVRIKIHGASCACSLGFEESENGLELGQVSLGGGDGFDVDGDLYQTIVGREDFADSLPAKKLNKCFSYREELAEILSPGDYVSVRTYTSGKTLCAGRVGGRAASWTSGFAPTSFGCAADSDGSELLGDTWFYVPPFARTGFYGSLLKLGLSANPEDWTVSATSIDREGY